MPVLEYQIVLQHGVACYLIHNFWDQMTVVTNICAIIETKSHVFLVFSTTHNLSCKQNNTKQRNKEKNEKILAHTQTKYKVKLPNF